MYIARPCKRRRSDGPYLSGSLFLEALYPNRGKNTLQFLNRSAQLVGRTLSNHVLALEKYMWVN